MISRSYGYIKCNSSHDLMDSACRTGIMALCDSQEDIKLLPTFEVGYGTLIRCPVVTWAEDNPSNFTRDQLTPFIAGCTKLKDKSIIRRVFFSHLSRAFFCQNKHEDFPKGKTKIPDICGPDVIWHMIWCGKIKLFYFFAPIGWSWLILSILWSSFVRPKDEQNQIISILLTQPKIFMDVYVYLYGIENIEHHLHDYWSGWRNQQEIAVLLFNQILIKLDLI